VFRTSLCHLAPEKQSATSEHDGQAEATETADVDLIPAPDADVERAAETIRSMPTRTQQPVRDNLTVLLQPEELPTHATL